jgi:hypothetical protein
MILKTVISQSNEKDNIYSEQPPITWGGADTGDYTTITTDSKTNIFVPSVAGVKNYNHGAGIIEFYGVGVLHCLWYSANTNETGVINVLYSKSINFGINWSAPVEIFEFQDDPAKNPASFPCRQIIASGFVVINAELYAVGDVNDLDTTVTPVRTGVGVLARKIESGGVFGAVYWIDDRNGTLTPPAEIPTYPTYTYNITLRNQIKTELIKNPEKRFVWYQGSLLNDILNTEGIHDSKRITEPSVCKLTNGQFLKLWRIVDTPPLFKIAQTSNNGSIWGATYETEIPDNPSKSVIFNYDNNIIIVGNNGTVNRYALFFAQSPDGYGYNSNNTYNIDKSTSNPVYSGLGKNAGCQYPSVIKLSNNKIACVYSISKEGIRIAIFDKPALI